MRKRHQKSVETPSKKVKQNNICILHVSGIEHGIFTSFKDIKTQPSEKLAYLHNVRDKRLAQPFNSSNRMEDVCNLIPDTLDGIDLSSIGYHRLCYQRFTKNQDRLKGKDEPASSQSHHSPRKSISMPNSTRTLFPPECIFCNKIEIKTCGKTERPTRFTLNSAWEPILTEAETLGKTCLARKIRGFDLCAVEAKCHTSCHRSFKTEFNNHRRAEERAKVKREDTEQAQRNAAHNEAFDTVLQLIDDQIIRNKDVVQLSSLRLVYIDKLDQCGHPNDNYRSDHLMKRLQKHPISSHIVFSKVDFGNQGCIAFYLVYNANITVADAVANAYKLATMDKVKDVALLLRGVIRRAFSHTKELSWPPLPDEMDVSAEDLPKELTTFLNIVLSGRPDDTGDKTQRLVLSIGQDLCRAVTEGEWKLPKHILLCMTVRHLYRSKQLATILNRLGHCEAYDFGLELETSLAKALDETSTLLTPQIVKGGANVVFHSEWDNLNKILTNVHGCNVVNSAGGIMIQETVSGHSEDKIRSLPTFDRMKTKEGGNTNVTPPTLPPLHIFKRAGPPMPRASSFNPPDSNITNWEKAMLDYRIWGFCRRIGSSGKQSVPALGGFISATGITPKKTSTIDYYTPINEPITENSTVAELLKRSAEATAEVGQKYTINTFDLGVCMKALPLIWTFPKQYEDHIVMIGQFHTVMNYLNMIGHKMAGSGYVEILIEADLVSSGCLRGVLNGKAYAKSIFCLKTVCEAMERLLMEQFMEEEPNLNIGNPDAILDLVLCCDRDKLDAVLRDPSTLHIIDKYKEYEDRVRSGLLGKTAVFWLTFIDHARRVFLMLYSVKVNDFKLFHKCNGDMAELFFAYGGQNYARYLTWFEVFLTNLELTHPGATDLLSKGSIAVARSMVPGALSAVDKTMEETFMKFAKSPGGLTGLFNMFAAYQRFCRTTSLRAHYFEKLLDMCNLISDPDCPKAGRHRELEAAEIKKSEAAVQRTVAAIHSFTNPFTIPNKNSLYSLASGAAASTTVEVDVLRAEKAGKVAKQEFIEDRFKDSKSGKTFYDPVKKLKLLTMEASNKTAKLTSSQGKLIQYKEQGDLAFQLLIKSQLIEEPLDLALLMAHSLTPVPPCLGTPDGFFAKTNKAAMLHQLLTGHTDDVHYPTDALHIQDGNALFHSLTDLPPTFGGICLKILDSMTPKKNFIFSTDCYSINSIKSQERNRRGVTQAHHLDGPSTRKPADMKQFLQNDENKQQLCRLLRSVWCSNEASSRLENCTVAVVVVVDGAAHRLSAKDGNVSTAEIASLRSNQEETDTRVVLYLQYAVTFGFKNVVVRTPDTDIFVILLHYATSFNLRIHLDTGIGKNRRLIDISSLASSIGDTHCTALMGLYVFTGDDCNCAFRGKGKVGPLKKLQQYPKFQKAFQDLGTGWTVELETLTALEEFTCIMYGSARLKSVNELRLLMLKKMVGEDKELSSSSKVDFSRLPPCKDSLYPHICRVNYRLFQWKQSHIPNFDCPRPQDGHGWTMDSGVLEPIWSQGPILPTSLVDILEKDTTPIEAEGELDEYEDLLEYLEEGDEE